MKHTQVVIRKSLQWPPYRTHGLITSRPTDAIKLISASKVLGKFSPISLTAKFPTFVYCGRFSLIVLYFSYRRGSVAV